MEVYVAGEYKVSEEVVSGDAQPLQHGAEGEVEALQIVVGEVYSLQEVLVGECEVGEVVPSQIEVC